MKIVVVMLILILTFSFLYAKSKKPKVFIEHEAGERFIPEDSDYIDLDHKENVSYKFDIYKIGVSQKLNKKGNYSIMYKFIDKDYNQSIDSLSSDDNQTKDITAYYSFKLKKIISFRLRTSFRKRLYDESQSTKENKRLSNSALMVIKPNSGNFFTNKKNEYSLNLKYKTTDYDFDADKDSNEISYYLNWKRKAMDKLTFKVRYKSTTLNYDKETTIRLNATRQSYLVRAEYQF